MTAYVQLWDGSRPFGRGEFRASSGAGRKRNRWTVAFWPYEHKGIDDPVPIYWRLLDSCGRERTWAAQEGAQRALDRLNLPYEIALFWHRKAVQARRSERDWPSRFATVCAQGADPFGLYI